jgi:1-acyl-sn-glycerol-3-phosphate acyltransferase
LRPAFDLVALGGSAASRARFHGRKLSGRFTNPPRTQQLVNHRSDWDITLTTNIYWPGRMWARDPRLVFVARDDMFLPGFLGGYPPGLPLAARRLLARVDVGRGLRLGRLALPVASAARARLADVALDDPALALAELPGDAVEPFLARARRLGRRAPRTLGELDGSYLDLLWRVYDRAELPGLDGFWGRRRARARRDFEALAAHVESGGSLTIYPEGRPSPDGAVGPLQRGSAVLIRRARPDALIVGGLAYDPLGRGRTRAYLALGPLLDPGADVLAELRRQLPQTPGQIAAHAAVQGLDPYRVELDGRPTEPRLRELLPDAVAAARTAPRALLERLDRELRSARGEAAGTPAAAAPLPGA